MSKTRTNRRLAFALAAALGLGALGLTTPAGADIDDLCGDVVNGCPDEIDDFTTPTPEPEPEPDPELPEGQPEADDDELPPADVDGTVVADANFTG